jgi:hypothetical protein
MLWRLLWTSVRFWAGLPWDSQKNTKSPTSDGGGFLLLKQIDKRWNIEEFVFTDFHRREKVIFFEKFYIFCRCLSRVSHKFWKFWYTKEWFWEENLRSFMIVEIEFRHFLLDLSHESMDCHDLLWSTLCLEYHSLEHIYDKVSIITRITSFREESIVFFSMLVDVFTEKKYRIVELAWHDEIENIEYATCTTIAIIKWVNRLELVMYHRHLDKWIDIVIW